MVAVTLEELTVDLQPDSVEWCPNKERSHLLAVGTYQLDEATATRHGRCKALCQLNPSWHHYVQSDPASPTYALI